MFLALLLAASLSGTVKSVDGQPLPGAHVTIEQNHQTLTATTDAAGTFSFPDVPLPATIDVDAPGFAPARVVATASPVRIVLVPAPLAESVVVTATNPPSWHDGATGATVLSRTDLDQIPAVTPDEMLHGVSGFSLYRRSSSRVANPTTDGVTMRGLSASGSSRGLVLFDDVPLNDGFGGWVTWTRLPPQAISAIEVNRGPAGDLFGSDALGGLIRIAPGTGNPPELFGSVEAGSLNTETAEVSAGRRVGGASVFGAADWFTSDGSIPLEPATRGAVDRPTDATWASGYARVDLGPAARRFSFSGWGGDDDRGNGTVLQRNKSHGGTFTTSFDGLASGFTIAARASVTPDWFYQTFTSVSADRSTEKLTSTQIIDADTTRGIVEVGHPIPFGQIEARASFARANANFGNVTPSASTDLILHDDSSAVSVEAGFAPLASVTFTTGIRHDWRMAPTDTSASDGATVGHAAAAWQAARRLVMHADAATSQRWPTLNELVRNFQVGSVLTEANPNLLPERAVSFEGGATWTASHWLASVTAFDSVVHDAVANVTISTTPTIRLRENAGDAHSHGVEADAETHVTSKIRLRLSTTFVNATFRNSIEPALEGNQLPEVPRASIGGGMDAEIAPNLMASFVSHTVSSQFDDDRNQFLLGAATQVDARLAGKLRRFGWQVVVENLFNANIETSKSPPVTATSPILITLAPGRAIRFGLNWRWTK